MSRRKELYRMDPNPLGIGGQADVFRAQIKETGKYVALKRLRDRRNKDALARMRREINVQTVVNDTNIMPILDYSYSFIWYTMPLAIKTAEHVKPPFENQLLLRIVESVVNGLLAAHKEGYIHRDVKPSNILLLDEENDQWVIADWGLVRTHGQTTEIRTEVGFHFGTPGYAAPELWVDAHNADERADVYGLGRVVAWAITGDILAPNIPIIPEGIWKEFVEKTTAERRSLRTKNMQDVLDLLEPIKDDLNRVNKKVVDNRFQPIKIIRIIEEDVTLPARDGSNGSALYLIPFELSRTPSTEWIEKFIDTWNNPPKYTLLHRKGIARVSRNRIILDGTTIEEVKEYHSETLSLAIESANTYCEKIRKQEQLEKTDEEKSIDEHRQIIRRISNDIEFD